MIDRRCHLKENRRNASKVGKAHQKEVGARHREFNSSDVQEKATTYQSAKKKKKKPGRGRNVGCGYMRDRSKRQILQADRVLIMERQQPF